MNKNTPAYLVGNYVIKDEAGLARYLEKVGPIVKKHGGKVIAFNRNVTTLEGQAQPVLVIVEFPTLKDAEQFYNSPEYAPVKPFRINATEGGFLIYSEGFPS